LIIDLHCHLDLYPDPFTIARQCRDQDIYILSVTTTPKAWQGTKKLARDNHKIKTALGFHPQLAHERHHELELFDRILPQAKYVGEIGLDGSKNYKPYWQVQLTVFRHILHSIDKAGGRIMSIHSRASAKAVLAELSGIKGIPVLHWFTGSKLELRLAIDQGCWFSVGPAMLSTKRGKDLVSAMPQQRIVTESDGPFAKWQRKSLMPWDVEKSFVLLAEIWRITPKKVREIISNNFKSLIALGNEQFNF